MAELPKGQVHLLLLHPGWGTVHHQQTLLHYPKDLLEEVSPGGKQGDWPCLVGLHGLQSHPRDQELWTGRLCFHPMGRHHHCHHHVQQDSMDQDLLLFAVEGLGPDMGKSKFTQQIHTGQLKQMVGL